MSFASRSGRRPTRSTLFPYTTLFRSSGAMAGVITTVDNNVGPWQSPANVSIAGAADLPIRLSDQQQGDLNVDAFAGKSDRKSTRLNSSHLVISYAVFCLKKKRTELNL